MSASLPAIPSEGEWTARWVEPAEPEEGPDVQRPAYHLAGEFGIDGPVETAHLHVSAHGIYEAFLNGVRIGDHELRPGFTAYRRRLQVQTFDVTDLIIEGTNVLGAIVSDGWWRGQHGIARAVDSYGPTVAFLAEVHVTLRSGEKVVAGTGPGWRSTPSHILAADLVAGEVHDMGRRIPRWCEPGTDRSNWDPARQADHGYAELVPTVGPPVRRIEDVAAVSLRALAPGRHVVDFGQNINGWVRLGDLGPAGTKITITHGEWLDSDGDVTQDNVRDSAFEPQRAEPLAFQTDVVVSAGDGDVFEPRHSTKGFRYVRVEGHPGPLDPASITGVVVHTDLARVGGFECSDERLNRLHRAAVWSFRGNACEIPTDCPTRERSGWTGDWQIYVGTAAHLFDVFDFSAKWLADLAADQRPDGMVLNIVPDPHDMDDEGPDLWREIQGSAGWGDATVHVPWELYLATGRIDLIEAQYESMQRWVDFAAARAASGRHPSRVERNPQPLPHETYVWDSGFHFGEWLEAGVSLAEEIVRILTIDHGPVATAYLYRSADELARIASLLGDATTADRYAGLAARVLDAWRLEFLDDGGRVTPATQANLVRALKFGLVPAGHRDRAVEDLVELVRSAGTHVGTGFLATPLLLPVLADSGHLDVAYELLLQDTVPSWLAMLDRGATTIWEEWEGVHADGTASASLNHYSKGGVIGFMHEYVAGLQIVDPGYRRFRVAPRPGGGISSARTHHDSPHGRIEVAWEVTDGAGRLEATVPDGTTVDLALPDGTADVLDAGRHTRIWSHRPD